jgi:ribonuclease HII
VSTPATVRIAGVDEAGRGPLAGPVVAAAVILDPARPIAGIADSKALTPSQRADVAALIRRDALCWAVGRADAVEIDALNILGATLLAMRRALAGLACAPARIHVDGNRLPRWVDLWPHAQALAVVRGDASDRAIGAASILAKTARDSLLEQVDTSFPAFGFSLHKGYPTPAHRQALRQQGASAIHRVSFAPVQSCLVARGSADCP